MGNLKDYNLKYTDEWLKPVYESRSKLSSFKDTPLKLFEFQNVTVLPMQPASSPIEIRAGGLYDESGNILECSKILPNRIINPQKINVDSAPFSHKSEAVYIGAFWEHWGHFILEQISRLYYLLNETKTNRPIPQTSMPNESRFALPSFQSIQQHDYSFYSLNPFPPPSSLSEYQQQLTMIAEAVIRNSLFTISSK